MKLKKWVHINMIVYPFFYFLAHKRNTSKYKFSNIFGKVYICINSCQADYIGKNNRLTLKMKI